jgi:hypothetical protein
MSTPRSQPAKADLRPPQLPQPEFAKSLGVDLETDSQAVVRRVGPIAIRTQAQLAQAALDRQDIGDRLASIDKFFEPFTQLAYKLHRALTTRRDEVKAPLVAVDLKLRNAIAAYKVEEDRRRREEEARLAEIRRREEQTRLTAEAAALEDAGDHVLADAVLEAALDAAPPVVVLPDTTKAEGLSFRTVWKWRFLHNDPDRAFQLIPREFLCVDEAKLTKYAAAMGAAARVPGVEFFSEQLPIRGRR